MSAVRRSWPFVFRVLSLASCALLAAACTAPSTASLERDESLGLPNGSRHGAYVFSGQPSAEDLETLQARGIRRVVSLRGPAEDEGMDETALCSELGLDFVRLPFDPKDPKASDDAAVDAILAEFRQGPGEGTLVHCGSAHRVAMLFAVHRVIDQAADLEEAIRDALRVGMRPGPAEDFIRAEVARLRTE